jgi:hypothetical protein
VTPRRSPSTLTAVLVAGLFLVTLAACSTAQPVATPSPTASAATASASPTPDLTPVPGGSAATSSGAVASPPTQTDTEWGRIWDALPASFPLPPDAVPTETGEGPASGSFAVGDTAQHTATVMQTALTGAGFSFESVEGPSEDGSYTLNAVGASPDCLAQVRVVPLSGTTNVVVLYGAACPWE